VYAKNIGKLTVEKNSLSKKKYSAETYIPMEKCGNKTTQ
jgi:hypothetical protein